MRLSQWGVGIAGGVLAGVLGGWGLSSDAWGATYYVDQAHPSANDSGPGTSETAPWLTLQRAMQSDIVAGDTVYVKNGTYDAGAGEFNPANSGTPSAPIAFRAFSGHRPVVTKPGGDPAGGNRMVIGADGRGSYVIWDGFTLGPWTNVLVMNADGVVLENLIIDKGASVPASCGQGNYNGIFVELANNTVIRNNIIRNINYTGCNLWNAGGIVLYEAHNTRIYNNEIYNTNTGINDKENGVSNIHEFNYFHDIAGPGVMFQGYATSRCGACPVENIAVRNNIFVNTDVGVYLNLSDPSRERNIDVYNNVLYNVRKGFGMITAIPDIDVYNNILITRAVSDSAEIDLDAIPADWMSNYNNFEAASGGTITFNTPSGAVTLTQWRTSLGADLNSTTLGSLFIGPLTGSIRPEAFRLSGISPLINQGRTGGVLTGTPVNMGAFLSSNDVVGLRSDLGPVDFTPPARPTGLNVR
ncbi:MAG: right-handed parallel beta-helix repeat-containing protein [Nitrospirota bacterium]